MARKQAPKASGRTLDEWITTRARELSMSLGELADRAHIDRGTLINIRKGTTGGHPKTIRNIEAALGWRLGSIQAILDGGSPTVVDVHGLVAATGPAFRAPDNADVTVTDADDPVVQLRQIRQRLGATAFWAVIERMRDEETTLRGSASAS